MKLIHFSIFSNLTKLKPSFQGTGQTGAERYRKNFRKPPYINFYINDKRSKIENRFNGYYCYIAVVDDDKLYDGSSLNYSKSKILKVDNTKKKRKLYKWC